MNWYVITAGICLTHGACHLALGIRRPFQSSHLLFAAMMAIICPFQLAVGAFRSATSIESVIELARYGVLFAILFIAMFGVFVHRYTRATLPRLLAYAFLASNAAWLAYDLLAPRGLLFSAGQPQVEIRSDGTSDGLGRVPTGAVELAWHAFNMLTMLWAMVAGWRFARRHQANGGIMLAIGTSVLLVTVATDALRDVLGRQWPYVGGFGVTVLASILSLQLASDFRAQENQLARMLADAMRVRDRLNTPLQILSVELELNKQQFDQDAFARMQRTLDKMTELGRALQTSDQVSRG